MTLYFGNQFKFAFPQTEQAKLPPENLAALRDEKKVTLTEQEFDGNHAEDLLSVFDVTPPERTLFATLSEDTLTLDTQQAEHQMKWDLKLVTNALIKMQFPKPFIEYVQQAIEALLPKPAIIEAPAEKPVEEKAVVEKPEVTETITVKPPLASQKKPVTIKDNNNKLPEDINNRLDNLPQGNRGKFTPEHINHTALNFLNNNDIERFNQLQRILLDKGYILDLSNKDLGGKNLQGANFEKTYLKGTHFERANLNQANFKKAYLVGASFKYSNLTQARFDFADLSYANLYAANMQYTHCENTNLDSAKLIYADLKGSNMSDAKLTNALLHNANLENAKLYRAEMSLSDLSRADLSHADMRFAMLHKALLEDTLLENTKLSYANLNEANMYRSVLKDVSTDGTHFYHTKIKGTTLKGVNFKNAYRLSWLQKRYIKKHGGIL